jgi:hypothetical protein
MLTQIAYIRQQITAAQRAGTPSARADHLQRALDGLERVEAQAKDALMLVDRLPDESWTVEELLQPTPKGVDL